jgi:O-antigen ligase
VVGYLPGMRAEGFGWYENSNDIAIILVTAIPLALLVANTAKAMPTRILFMAIAAMFAFNIMFTGSRNGMLGLLAVGALSIYFSERVPKLIRTLLFVGLVIGVFTVGIASILGRSDLVDTGLTGDDSSENRIEQWKVGLSMLKHHPILGVGPGEFTTYEKDYGGVQGLQPHNTLLQVFAESGLLGGISFALMAFYPFVYLKKLLKFSKNTKIATPVMFYKLICASLAGFWVCAFFSNRYQFYILYVIIALSQAVKFNIINETDGKRDY